MGSETFTQDNLIAGTFPLVTESVTIAAGADLVRKTVLGQITIGTVPSTGTGTGTGNGTMTAVTGGLQTKVGTYTMTCLSITADGATITVPTTGVVAGTGNGTCTGVADGGSAIAGAYVATCIDASVSGSEIFQVIDPNANMLENATVDVAYTSDQIDFTINDGSTDFIVGDTVTITVTSAPVDSDSGLFSVVDPDGNRMPDANADVAYTDPQLNFTINDGSTDFEVGDAFTVVVPAGSGKYAIVLSTAIDGTQHPAAVLAEDAAAASADVTGVPVYLTGQFNDRELIFGGSDVVADHKVAMRALSMFPTTTIDVNF